MTNLTENLEIDFKHLQPTHQDEDVHLDVILSPFQELKLVITDRDLNPAVGVLDVIHQTPDTKGKGTLVVTYHEALEWGASPITSKESWQKVSTIKNHSKSNQPVTIRFFFLRK